MTHAKHLSTGDRAVVRETHSGVVILLGDRAYKLKKPVDLGFLDFSTRARREEAYHRETRLNRRLAPDVYLGVGAVTDPAGEPCESLVVMRRMPDELRLPSLVAAGVDVGPHLRRLAREVAAFHATAHTSPEIAESGSPARLLARWSGDASRPVTGLSTRPPTSWTPPRPPIFWTPHPRPRADTFPATPHSLPATTDHRLRSVPPTTP